MADQPAFHDLLYTVQNGLRDKPPMQVDGIDVQTQQMLLDRVQHFYMKWRDSRVIGYRPLLERPLWQKVLEPVARAPSSTIPDEVGDLLSFINSNWVDLQHLHGQGHPPFADPNGGHVGFDIIHLLFHYDTDYSRSKAFAGACNALFERERAAFRIVFPPGRVVPLSNNEELAEIQEAFTGTTDEVKSNLDKALAGLRGPDNGLSDAVLSAVKALESQLKEIAGAGKTLADAVNIIRRDPSKLGVHDGQLKFIESLLDASKGLYQWRNDVPAHGQSQADAAAKAPFKPTLAEARFAIVAASACINYLKAKAGRLA